MIFSVRLYNLVKSSELKIQEKLGLAIENHKNKKFQLAEKLYKEILVLNKDHVEANYQLGTLYSQLQNFNLAKPLLAKAHKLSPNNPNIILHIGNLLLSAGEPLEAINYFEKFIHGNLIIKFNKFCCKSSFFAASDFLNLTKSI